MRLRGSEMKQKGMCKNTVVNTGIFYCYYLYLHTFLLLFRNKSAPLSFDIGEFFE